MMCKIIYRNQEIRQVKALKVIRETKNDGKIRLENDTENFKIKVSKKTKRVWRELNGYKFESPKANIIILC